MKHFTPKKNKREEKRREIVNYVNDLKFNHETLYV